MPGMYTSTANIHALTSHPTVQKESILSQTFHRLMALPDMFATMWRGCRPCLLRGNLCRMFALDSGPKGIELRVYGYGSKSDLKIKANGTESHMQTMFYDRILPWLT